ncbi:hypothetical protein SDC9_78602 [bioreactor metagenome]|uniref:Uncharacterized protein n=1 Tax=bioreactor metagenome TaxID=1076179 RepID=A0A644Z1J0_9ZZZZ
MFATKSLFDDILRPILAHVTKRVELASLKQLLFFTFIVSYGYPVKYLNVSDLVAYTILENMRKLNNLTELSQVIRLRLNHRLTISCYKNYL